MKMQNSSPFTLLLSSLAYFSGQLDVGNPYVEIDIAQGRIRGGKSVARNGEVYMEFLGIPYAKPPVGNLRFEPPQPPPKWSGIWQATNYGKSCLQYEFLTHFRTGGEDCLNLNVYTNQVLNANQAATTRQGGKRIISSWFSSLLRSPNSEAQALKPVIVYLFGGLFMSGFSYVYRAKYFMEQNNVVLVTLNYRLNSFGFLNTGDGVVRGNMGLKDQTMALQWVQENIMYFGGDRNQVTLMGQSAGAASVQYHMLSPMSTGLFKHAISQSGSALSSWAFSNNPREQAERLAISVNCPITNSTAMIKCLKSIPSYEIEKFHREYLDPLPDPLSVFAPSVEKVVDENTFLAESPRQLLKRGVLANKVPWITGVNNAEGFLTALYLLKSTARLRELTKNVQKFLPRILSYEQHPDKVSISNQIYNYYFSSHKISSKSKETLMPQLLAKLYSDAAFFRGAHDSIELMSKLTTVYPYYFMYGEDGGITNIQTRMVGNGLPRLIDFGLGNARKWVTERLKPETITGYGAAHADELIYQFNIPVIAEEINPGSRDYEFSYEFIKLWTSFIKNGKPSAFKNKVWNSHSPKPSNETIQYFKIDNDPGMIPEPFSESVKFWKSLNLEET